MATLSKKKKNLIIILSIIFSLIFVISIYRFNKINLFDKSAYKELYKDLEIASEDFKCQQDMTKYITNWADSQNLNYKIDYNKNLIFTQNASSTKANVSPTIIITNYNYENAVDNKKVIASAAMIAKTKLDNAGKKIIIFINNEKNDGSNYYNLDKSYFTNNSKVIYLDYGKLDYISTKSFNSVNQTFKVPTERTESKCDTAIKIKIKGLRSDCIDASINKKANPITLFSTLLTRLKSKSTICELADFKVNNKGNMYPDELHATILMNSYSVESFTKYLDKRIKVFEKACKNDNPECEYSYSIIKKKTKIPDDVYTKKTLNSLTTLLYAINNGSERFQEDNVIPDGYDVNDIYGIVCPNQLRIDNGNIYLDVYSQAVDRMYINQITKENKTAAELAKCELINYINCPSFNNKKNKLINTLQRTYFKVTNLSGAGLYLSKDNDTYFTPMSYLSKINKKMDIVHIKENSKSAAVITNMLICYIQTKGNFLSL